MGHRVKDLKTDLRHFDGAVTVEDLLEDLRVRAGWRRLSRGDAVEKALAG